MSPVPAFLPGFGAGSILLTSKPFLSSRRLRAPSRTPPLARRPLLVARGGFDYREAESKSAAAAEDAFNPTPATTGQTFDSGRAASISRQLEFWFSPNNLKRDWFLRRQMDPDGWLDPSLFLKFSKLKTLNVSLSELIAACGLSDALEISAPPTDGSGFGDNLGQTRVRSARRASEREADLDAESERSIVVTGFDDALVVIDDLRTLFSAYGEVLYSHLAKSGLDRAPAHAIISYGTTEAAMEAVRRFCAGKPDGAPEEMEIVSKVLWDAQSGRRKSKSVVLELAGLASDLEWREVWDDITNCFRALDVQIVYFLFKNGETVCHVTVSDQDVADIVLEDLCDDGVMSVCGSSVVVRPLVDEEELDDYWRTASMQILERKRRKEHYAMSRGTDSSSPNSRGGQDNYNPAGVIVYVDGLGSDVGWQDLMSALRKLGNVVFLNYRNGSEDCHVRFVDADTAADVVDQLSGDDPATIVDAVVTATVLEGEEEEEYWRRASAERKRRKAKRYADSRQD